MRAAEVARAPTGGGLNLQGADDPDQVIGLNARGGDRVLLYQLRVQLGTTLDQRPLLQGAPEVGIPRRSIHDPKEERPQIEAGPTDHQGNLAPGLDLRDEAGRSSLEVGRVRLLRGRIEVRDQVMGNARELIGCRLSRADVEAPVDLLGIGGDHLPANALGHLDGQAGLPRGGGPADENHGGGGCARPRGHSGARRDFAAGPARETNSSKLGAETRTRPSSAFSFDGPVRLSSRLHAPSARFDLGHHDQVRAVRDVRHLVQALGVAGHLRPKARDLQRLMNGFRTLDASAIAFDQPLAHRRLEEAVLLLLEPFHGSKHHERSGRGRSRGSPMRTTLDGAEPQNDGRDPERTRFPHGAELEALAGSPKAF